MAKTPSLYENSARGLLIGAFVIVFVAWISKCVMIWWQQRRRLVELAAKLPGPKGLPLIGSALHFACKPEQLLDRVVQLVTPYQDVTPIRVWAGPLLHVVIAEPRDIEVVLNSRKATLKGSMYRLLQPFIGDGLISGSGHTWRSYRKLVAPMFNVRTLESFAEVVRKHSRTLVGILKPLANGVEFDVGPYVSRCTMDVLCETTMGCGETNSQGEPDRKFIHATDMMYELVHNRMMKIWLYPDWIFRLSSSYKEQQKCMRVIHKSTEKIIYVKQKEFAVSSNGESGIGNKDRNSILEQLFRRTQHSEHLSKDEELRDQMHTIYQAAQDAMALIVNFALLMLGIHKDIQENVRSELNRVLQDEEEDIPASSLPEFKYLEMVTKETMRLFPIGPFLMRRLRSDLALETCVIPEGCEVALAFFLTHRNPRFWKTPEKFIPERFTPEEIALRHPYAYVPFSGGLMSCIGQKFAMNSLKLIVANVVRRYRIDSTVRMEDIKLKTDISIRSIDGYKISLESLDP